MLRSFSTVQEPLQPSDLKADDGGLQQHGDDGSTARLAAWLATEALDVPRPAHGASGAMASRLPDVGTGPLLAAIEAAAATASPVAAGLETKLVERTSTPEGVPQALRSLEPADQARCAHRGVSSA